MTEAEWLACGEPERMLAFLRGRGDGRSLLSWLGLGRPVISPVPVRRASDRKLRLYACALCRRVADFWDDPRCRVAVETAEQFADGLADEAELLRARRDAEEVARLIAPPGVSWMAGPLTGAFNFGTARAAAAFAAAHAAEL